MTALELPRNYVALCPECRSLLFICTVEHATSKEGARDIAGVLKDGLDIVRMTSDEVKAVGWDHKPECSRKPVAKKAQKAVMA